MNRIQLKCSSINDCNARVTEALMWLVQQVGDATTSTDYVGEFHTTAYRSNVARLFNKHEVHEDAQIMQICELGGVGWSVFRTFEQMVSDGLIMAYRHMLYITVDDESSALQFKLAMS
jgi:negative regulator of sigma E activity